jgi:2-oxo-4-hydroxy-4-carboxy-5-ureidoimidazoline decarboxylase
MTDSDVAQRMNRMTDAELIDQLLRCCSSTAWCDAVARRRPFADRTHLHRVADEAFDALSQEDWLQAFAGHPKIGDIGALRIRFGGDADWSQAEQSPVASADEETLVALADGNRRYEAKFGFIFIVCATGKSAAEMLRLLLLRLPGDRQTEIAAAAAEQRKITHLRIDKF